MTLEGLLEDLSIIELFQLIDMGNKTGILEIIDDSSKNKATIFFDKGVLTHIRLKENVKPVHEMLEKAGLVTRAQMDFAHQYQQRMPSKKKFGSVLLKLNYISRHNLRKIIHQQMEEALYSLFDWMNGSFKFYDVVEIESIDFPLKMSVEKLILEGSRRQDEWTQIEPHVPHLNVRFRFREQKNTSQFPSLESEEWKIMTNIDGKITAGELALKQGLNNFVTCKILSNLVRKGIVEVIPDSI
ncbi:MAG: hypothetical protein B6244_07605 [Candidatus Cloacimonetes bacterium 4572_55]|nr:MAG: hypothetical protein B6244_07605 [Candidatus Cloacimonetes bacterium 4572_55]